MKNWLNIFIFVLICVLSLNLCLSLRGRMRLVESFDVESFDDDFTDEQNRFYVEKWNKLKNKSGYSNPKLCMLYYNYTLQDTDDRSDQEDKIIKKMNNFKDIKFNNFKDNHGFKDKKLKYMICLLKHDKKVMIFDIYYKINDGTLRIWLFFIIDEGWIKNEEDKKRKYIENRFTEMKDMIYEYILLSLVLELKIRSLEEQAFIYSKYSNKTLVKKNNNIKVQVEEISLIRLLWLKEYLDENQDSKLNMKRVEIKLDEYGEDLDSCLEFDDGKGRRRGGERGDMDLVKDKNEKHDNLVPLYGLDETLHGYVFSNKKGINYGV